MLFDEQVLSKFNAEKIADVYSIDLLIDFQETIGDVSSPAGMISEVICHLKLPLSFNGTSTADFQTTDCLKVCHSAYYWMC